MLIRVLLKIKESHELGVYVVLVDEKDRKLEEAPHHVRETACIREELDEVVGNPVVLDLLRGHEEVGSEDDVLSAFFVIFAIGGPLLDPHEWGVAHPERSLDHVQEVKQRRCLQDIEPLVLGCDLVDPQEVVIILVGIKL